MQFELENNKQQQNTAVLMVLVSHRYHLWLLPFVIYLFAAGADDALLHQTHLQSESSHSLTVYSPDLQPEKVQFITD